LEIEATSSRVTRIEQHQHQQQQKSHINNNSNKKIGDSDDE
jgi:hypothetical protein